MKSSLKTKLRLYRQKLEEGKAAYQEADRLLEELTQSMMLGVGVSVGAGEEATLVDRFAVKNKVWKPACVNRFDVEFKQVKVA